MLSVIYPPASQPGPEKGSSQPALGPSAARLCGCHIQPLPTRPLGPNPAPTIALCLLSP